MGKAGSMAHAEGAMWSDGLRKSREVTGGMKPVRMTGSRPRRAKNIGPSPAIEKPTGSYEEMPSPGWERL